MHQLQTPPRSQTSKKERPPSWQTEKDGPCKFPRSTDVWGDIKLEDNPGPQAYCTRPVPFQQSFDSHSSADTSGGESTSSSGDAGNGEVSSGETTSDEEVEHMSERKSTASSILTNNRSNEYQQNDVSSDSSISDTASTTTTDYGEFPDAQNLLDCLPIPQLRTEPELCDEQRDLVDMIMRGNNVFYTGSAGCGKSTVLRSIVSQLKAKGKRVRIVAYTGRAALEVGGVTIHSYAGWNPDSIKRSIKKLKKAAHGMKMWRKFQNTDVLIIDEISMVENHCMERLNLIMKDSREDSRPFGGVQIIVTGDFCQLPPVKPFQTCMECGKDLKPSLGRKKYQCEESSCKDQGLVLFDKNKWAFCSEAWEECNFVHINLTTVHRQKDLRFKFILEKIRFGQVPSPEEVDYLFKRTVSAQPPELRNGKETNNERFSFRNEKSTAVPIKLFPTRGEVAEENETQLDLLDGHQLTFYSYDNFDWNPKHTELKSKSEPGTYEHSLKALDEHSLVDRLDMKIGMPVILLVNLDIDAGLINGSQGILVGFEHHDSAKLPDLLGSHTGARQRLTQHYIHNAETKEWPIVRFPDSGNQERTIYPRCMMNEMGDIGEDEDENQYSLLSRTQIPLAAAWAITIHKSQGMTLSRLQVDLSRAFNQAQCYVALSRARDLEGLTIVSLGYIFMGANPQVMAFLEEKNLLNRNKIDNIKLQN